MVSAAHRRFPGSALRKAALQGTAGEARRLIGRGEGTSLIKASRSMRFERVVEGL